MNDFDLPNISDEQMRERLALTGEYSLVLLETTPATFEPASGPVIWEHGRRNMALRAAGVMPIVCPATDGGELAGICVLNVPLERAIEIMRSDPAVQAGVLSFVAHPIRGFPGDSLPTAAASADA